MTSMQMTQSLCLFLAEAKYYSMIEANKKPCINSKSFVRADSYIGGTQRFLYGESAKNLLLHINLYASSVHTILAEYKNTVFLSTILTAVDESLTGLRHLLITYKTRPAITTDLSVIIRNIEFAVTQYAPVAAGAGVATDKKDPVT